jgi:hypothetical protein
MPSRMITAPTGPPCAMRSPRRGSWISSVSSEPRPGSTAAATVVFGAASYRLEAMERKRACGWRGSSWIDCVSGA